MMRAGRLAHQLRVLLIVTVVVISGMCLILYFRAFHQQPAYLETAEDAPQSLLDIGNGKCGGIFGNKSTVQADPDLVTYIQTYHLTPPSTKPYALGDFKESSKNPSEYGSEIMKLFANKRGGFFIEAGANDGEYRSNTLQLEREYGWTGLLIEPNPFMLVKLRMTNRKAWIAGVCLSLGGYPQKIRFMHRVGPLPWMNGMGIIEHSASNPVPPNTKRNPSDYIYAGPVECFPLYSILTALNQTIVDYFSLDIEGIELRVLKAIPFDLVTIKAFSIEYNLIPEGEFGLINFLKSKGYIIVLKVHVEIFAVHRDYMHEFGVLQFAK